jgi:hypothetical protein
MFDLMFYFFSENSSVQKSEICKYELLNEICSTLSMQIRNKKLNFNSKWNSGGIGVDNDENKQFQIWKKTRRKKIELNPSEIVSKNQNNLNNSSIQYRSLRRQRSKKTLFLNLYDYPHFRWVMANKICETKENIYFLSKRGSDKMNPDLTNPYRGKFCEINWFDWIYIFKALISDRPFKKV